MSTLGKTTSRSARENIAIRRLARGDGLTRRQLVAGVMIAAGEREVASLSVVLVADAFIARLHAEYMDDPTPTDVLTFDLSDGGGAIEGEVVVSIETAAREAKARGLPHGEEVLRYVIHGTLHLVGYDDSTPALRRRMRAAEDRVLAELREMGVLPVVSVRHSQVRRPRAGRS